VQSIDNKVIAAYTDRIREEIPLAPKVDENVRQAMQDVVYDGNGTAHSAKVKGLRMAGKTGTAQWGKRTAAWFAGFTPAEDPRYAFAAVYEGAPGDDDVHGGSHAAPMIGKVFKEIVKLEKERAGQTVVPTEDEPEEPAPKDESN
jgi:penicillin-binding protein 2